MRLAFVLVSLLCNAAVASPGLRELRKEAAAAYEKKDYAQFLKLEQQLVQLAPVPVHLYGLACAQALTGDAAAARKTLEDVAAYEIAFPAAKDPDLASLRDDPVMKRFEVADLGDVPVERVFPRSDLVVEDLARGDGAWYFTSVAQKAVFVWPDGGALRELAKTPWGAFGLDYVHGALWVSSTDEKQSAVLELDARTGAQKQRFDVRGALGDLRAGPDGAVYVSDGAGGIVYVIHEGQLRKLVDGLASPQTQAVRGQELIVADYTLGIAAVNLQTRAVRFVSRMPGVDGIAADGDDVYLVANGVNPPRVLRLHEDKLETLQRGGDLADPTHAVVHDGALWFIARSGWEKSGKPPLLKRYLLRPTGQATPVPPRPQ